MLLLVFCMYDAWCIVRLHVFCMGVLLMQCMRVVIGDLHANYQWQFANVHGAIGILHVEYYWCIICMSRLVFHMHVAFWVLHACCCWNSACALCVLPRTAVFVVVMYRETPACVNPTMYVARPEMNSAWVLMKFSHGPAGEQRYDIVDLNRVLFEGKHVVHYSKEVQYMGEMLCTK